MRAVLHVSKFYSWEPIPPDTKVTPADISSERVRVAANGGYAMRVTRQQASHTTVLMPEADVVGKIIHERTRPSGGRVLTRKQAIAFALGEDVLPHHAKKEWITKIEVHDDGPDEKLARALFVPHAVSEASRVAACKSATKHLVGVHGEGAPERCPNCGHMPSVGDPSEEPNIPVDDLAEHMTAYTEACSADDLVAHLHAHFKVKVKP